MMRSVCIATFAFLSACSSPDRVFQNDVDTGSPDTTADTTPTETSMPGDLGAPCTKNEECLSKFCLDIGRCSKACPSAGICPNSSNWTCTVVPTLGPMCACDVLSMTDVPCNGIDDNCDGKIDEDSPQCGGKCVDTMTDNAHCGGCDKPCEGGSSCKMGKCECPMDKPDLCAMSCVDTKTDNAHCGGCDKPCMMGENCKESSCSKIVGVDVMVLLDVTGSNVGQLNLIKATLNTRLVAPLLKIEGVQVGVSYTSEFPTSPYGGMGDQPFKGGIEPSAMESAVTPLITGFPPMSGGDEGDGMVEALGTLAGRPLHPTSTALMCSMGRVPGGCWRTGVKRVVVLVTDDIFHNAPDPAAPTMLYVPYMGITPAPQVWADVLKAMTADKMALLIMNSNFMGATAPGLKQWEIMLKDLGQPATDIYLSNTDAAAMTASDEVVKRVTAIKAL
jgi:hypothetical protein